MQKKLFAVAAVVVLLVIGAGAFYIMSKTGKVDSVDKARQNGISQVPNMGSINELLGRGENVMCSVKYTGKEMSGTVYVSGLRVRGDFTVVEGGQTSENHMIQDSEYIYVWEGTDQGMKIKVESVSEQASPGTDVNKPLDLDEQVEMDCNKWNVDESVFIPPVGVKFTDVADALKSFNEQSNKAQDVTEETCAQIEDEQSKAACMSATRQ